MGAGGWNRVEGRPRDSTGHLLYLTQCKDCGSSIRQGSERCRSCSFIRQTQQRHEARIARQTRTCIGCGVSFVRTRKKRDAGKYCTRECAFAHSATRYAANNARRRAEGRIKAQERAFMAAEERARRSAVRSMRSSVVRLQASLATVDRVCRVCGKGFQRPLFRPGRHSLCSRECRREASRQIRRQRRRKHGHDRRHTDRAKRAGVAYIYGITQTKVFTRDRWTCQLCGCRTPKRLKGRNMPRSPEIDHIIPISLGGTHTWENVQCACHACNMEKGANVLGQLRLTL